MELMREKGIYFISGLWLKGGKLNEHFPYPSFYIVLVFAGKKKSHDKKDANDETAESDNQMTKSFWQYELSHLDIGSVPSFNLLK